MWLAPGEAQLILPLYLLIGQRHRRSLSQDDPYRFRIGSYRLVPSFPDLLLVVADRLHFGSRLLCITLTSNAEPGLHPGLVEPTGQWEDPC